MWYFSSKLNSQSRNRNIGNHFPFSTNWGNLIYDPIGFLWLAPLCNGFYSFISNTEQPLDGSYFLPRSMSEFFNAGIFFFPSLLNCLRLYGLYTLLYRQLIYEYGYCHWVQLDFYVLYNVFVAAALPSLSFLRYGWTIQ